MAEAFVRTMKRDYVRIAEKPDARAVINQWRTVRELSGNDSHSVMQIIFPSQGEPYKSASLT